MRGPDLTIIIPVYNEEEIIQEVVRTWITMLQSLKIHFIIKAYNDGSKDATLKKLNELAETNSELQVIDKPNSGHGPTILNGYRESDSPWIFQVDSDNEMEAVYFIGLWEVRDEYDLILGKRVQRVSPFSRRIITSVARLTNRILYGSTITDVNSPYRLYRREAFIDAFDVVPPDTFAPNVLLSGYASANKLRIAEVPVPAKLRQTGEVSIQKFKLFKVAIKSLRQTIRFRFSLASNKS
jgi:glycosyltransferase involved in cell wall biosynthesis